jgi:hypothetical protein
MSEQLCTCRAQMVPHRPIAGVCPERCGRDDDPSEISRQERGR